MASVLITTMPGYALEANVTKQAAITPEFMGALQRQSALYSYSKLAFESYSLVAGETFYSMWDVVSVCWLARPDLFDPPQRRELGIVTQGYCQGTILNAGPGGRSVDVVLNIADKQGFYEYVLGQLRR